MLDIRFILKNLDLVKENTRERHIEADIDKAVALYQKLREEVGKLEGLQRRTNQIAEQFRVADEMLREKLKSESNELKLTIPQLKTSITQLEKEYKSEMLKIPNLAAPEVPQGRDEVDNIPIKHFGNPTVFDFEPLDQIELAARLDIVEFEAATKVVGQKFYFLKNEGVFLELALVRYALDLAVRHGFTPMTTPEIARDDIIAASGFTPRGPESQIYGLADSELSLIGTSEITIGGFMAGVTIREEDLPVKIAGVSHCFRTEAGSYGRESRGLYRVHQFTKVELYQFVLPEMSRVVHEEILEIEEKFYQSLKLPYRVLLICKGDLGAPAYKKYDIEAWIPSMGTKGGYGEVTSASNCTDFQARRLGIRYKRASTGKTDFVHTLNGTAVAVTRTMLAILENCQQRDGSVLIPEVLQPYIGFRSIESKRSR